MELRALEVENFRQFYGTQRLEFATGDRNVTVVHGSNGSGKTTLLNSFLWLFYDEITLPQPDQVASERALAEAEPGDLVTTRVRLVFTHEGSRYEAERVTEFEKRDDNDLSGTEAVSEVTLEYTDDRGNTKRRKNPETALKQIMPERLREIFFFDGETIDQLSAIGEQEKIQEAIRKIMGLEILERAKRHLDEVQGRFEDEMQEHGSEELSDLVEERNRKKTIRSSREEELSEFKNSKEKTRGEIEDIDDRLATLEDSRELQERREDLKQELAETEDDIEAIDTDLAEVISSDGYLPFALPAVTETAEMLREKRQKGEIPSEIKGHFVDDLLDLGECICGRPLESGTVHYENVEEWKGKAGSSELEQAALNIAGRFSEMGEDEEALFGEIESLLERRRNKVDRKREYEEEIDEISDKLTDKDTEDVRELEERRQDLEDNITDYDQEIGSLRTKIEKLDDKIEELNDEISEARQKNQKAETARRRAQTAAYLHDRIETLHADYQDQVRQDVNQRVNDIFQEIISKDYYAKITDDYSLRILKDVGEQKEVEVARSTGERQVASLSFIATLVSLARERYESDENTAYFTGGIYPMIMDSPFGYLDPDYQQSVSRMLPGMADQVVVLVTQSQWSDAVAGEMDAVAGERYYLRYHDPAEDGDAEFEQTEITSERVVQADV
jgi:DNA sulfur modification protein DndD